jgi:spermidine synthase
MKPIEVIGRTRAEDGTELVLYHRDGVYQIRVNGLELMSSRAHGSEEALARLACSGLHSRTPKILVGGLGIGYTLRAALDQVPAGAEVIVAEVFPAVVEWCRGPLAELARRPLDDPRVSVEVADVCAVLSRSRGRFDVILLDVDNGPDALTLAANDRLYQQQGIGTICRALKTGGVVAVWSAEPDRGFVRRLRRAGLKVHCQTVRARATSGPRHTVFLGQKQY